MKPVEGHSGLVRGPGGQILSVDAGALERAKAEKAKAQQTNELASLLAQVLVEIRQLREELKVGR